MPQRVSAHRPGEILALPSGDLDDGLPDDAQDLVPAELLFQGLHQGRHQPRLGLPPCQHPDGFVQTIFHYFHIKLVTVNIVTHFYLHKNYFHSYFHSRGSSKTMGISTCPANV
jgi:hypothetical protein